MKKVTVDIYIHRGIFIMRDEQGIFIDWKINQLDLYATLEDARQAINKYLDGSNTKEPRIVGTWH